jgi:hypothetical protein
MEDSPAASASFMVTTSQVTAALACVQLFVPAGGPATNSPLHRRVGEKSIALIAQKWAVNYAGHVATRRNFGCGDLNLVEVPIRVLNACAVDNAIEAGPERGAHAHGTRFASGVKRVAAKRKLLESLGRQTNGANLGMRAWVELACNIVERLQQRLAGFCANDGCAEGSRTRGAQRAGRKGNKRSHALCVSIESGFAISGGAG